MLLPGGCLCEVCRVFFSEFAGNSEGACTSVPYCAMEQAQISYHAHRDAVRFFVSIPGNRQERLVSSSWREAHTEEELRARLLKFSRRGSLFFLCVCMCVV